MSLLRVIISRSRTQFVTVPCRFRKSGPSTSNFGKRSSMLQKLVLQTAKKPWHLYEKIADNKKDESIFNNAPRTNRRAVVLNALFIRNITEVISTGDIAPEMVGLGIEITRLKITLDYQIVNVYWQIPPSMFDCADEIQIMLAHRSRQIRAELISRNIMGKVPHLFFVRDLENARFAEFEQALKIADLGPEQDRNKVPDMEILKKKKLFQFNSSRESVRAEATEKGEMHSFNEPKTPEDKLVVAPSNPLNMRTNLLGLNHDYLMNKVIMAKKKARQIPQETERSDTEEADDLFSRIQGMPLRSNADRQKAFKQFCIDRKKQLQQKLRAEVHDDDVEYATYHLEESLDKFVYEEDYYDEEEEHRDSEKY